MHGTNKTKLQPVIAYYNWQPVTCTPHGCVFPFCTAFPVHTGVAFCRYPLSQGFVISEGIEPLPRWLSRKIRDCPSPVCSTPCGSWRQIFVSLIADQLTDWLKVRVFFISTSQSTNKEVNSYIRFHIRLRARARPHTHTHTHTQYTVQQVVS